MLPKERVREVVERHFRIYDERDESQPEMGAHLFFVMFPKEEFDDRFERLRRGLKTLDPDALVFLRQEGGEDVICVTDRPPSSTRKTRTHLVLMVLTMATTVMAGAFAWYGYTGAEGGFGGVFAPRTLLRGAITFALPLMAILGIHEMAHFFAAKKHGLRPSLPFFIPVPYLPGLPFGTLGAFISMRDPMPDRKALFDIGASGPVAGFLVAVPVIIAGAFLTVEVGQPIPDIDRPLLETGAPSDIQEDFGEITLKLQAGIQWVRITAPPDDEAVDYLFTLTSKGLRETHTVTLEPNATALRTIDAPEKSTLTVTWEDGLVQFGDPLLVKGMNAVGFGAGDHLMHPMYFAGWAGLLLTGINLLPVGQLDGGHVARAVLGERARYAGYAAVGLLMVLALFFRSWLLMALFVLLLGVQHPPPLNDRTVLPPNRIVMAVGVLLVFAVTFVARPVIF